MYFLDIYLTAPSLDLRAYPLRVSIYPLCQCVQCRLSGCHFVACIPHHAGWLFDCGGCAIEYAVKLTLPIDHLLYDVRPSLYLGGFEVRESIAKDELCGRESRQRRSGRTWWGRRG